MRFEILTAVLLMFQVFLSVKECHCASSTQCFRRPYCFHLQGQVVQEENMTLKMKAT